MMNDLLSQIKNPEDKAAIMKAAQFLKEEMKNENKSLQEVLMVKDELLEEIYSLAFGNYNQGKYNEAASLFYLLVGIAPKFKYLFGLASAFHQLKDYKNAATGYSAAFIIEPTNPLPIFYISDCCLKAGDLEGALEGLDLTLQLTEGKPEHRQLRERCLLIKKSLEKKLKSQM